MSSDDHDDQDDFQMIEFWGEEIPPGGKPYAVDIENEPPVFSMVHVTNCALGENPRQGPHVLKAAHGTKHIVLATLEKGVTYQYTLDFGISSSTTFINTGPSPVFVSGYITRSIQHMEGSDEEDEDEELDSEEEDMEDDDYEAPKLVPLNNVSDQKTRSSRMEGSGLVGFQRGSVSAVGFSE